jgi:hypothetical protein
MVRLGRSWSGNASGTKMGGEVGGTVEQGRGSLDKVVLVSLVSESVDHSSEVSESAVSSSESGLCGCGDVAVSGSRCKGLSCCRRFLLDDLFFRNPIRLCGRGGISGSLACDIVVNKDLTSASYVKLLPLVGPPPSRGIFDYGKYRLRS